MTDQPRRALRPADYENGRPDLTHLHPFVGGTPAEQRAAIAARKRQWAAEQEAAEAARLAEFYRRRDERAAAHAARRKDTDG